MMDLSGDAPLGARVRVKDAYLDVAMTQPLFGTIRGYIEELGLFIVMFEHGDPSRPPGGEFSINRLEIVDLKAPWEFHVEWMDEHYGRRDPECFWCGERVVMSLQGFYGGGIWTSDHEDEGPGTAACGPGVTCPTSPDGAHDVLSPRPLVA